MGEVLQWNNKEFAIYMVCVPAMWMHYRTFCAWLSHKNYSQWISPIGIHCLVLLQLANCVQSVRFQVGSNVNAFSQSLTMRVNIWDLFPQNERQVAKFHFHVITRFMLFRLRFKMIYYMSGLLPYLGSKTYYFLENFLLVPWRLVAHFVRTGLIFLLAHGYTFGLSLGMNSDRASSKMDVDVTVNLYCLCFNFSTLHSKIKYGPKYGALIAPVPTQK